VAHRPYPRTYCAVASGSISDSLLLSRQYRRKEKKKRGRVCVRRVSYLRHHPKGKKGRPATRKGFPIGQCVSARESGKKGGNGQFLPLSRDVPPEKKGRYRGRSPCSRASTFRLAIPSNRECQKKEKGRSVCLRPFIFQTRPGPGGKKWGKKGAAPRSSRSVKNSAASFCSATPRLARREKRKGKPTCLPPYLRQGRPHLQTSFSGRKEGGRSTLFLPVASCFAGRRWPTRSCVPKKKERGRRALAARRPLPTRP